MDDHDALQMMHRCKNEIQTLRGEIAALRPKAEAYDAITRILGLLPRSSQPYGEDLVWVIDREAQKISARIAAAAKPDGAEEVKGR